MGLNSWYDPLKDEIHGTEKGTLSYRHEEGHQDSWKRGVEPQIQMWSWLILVCSIFGLGWMQDNLFIKILCAIPVALLIYSELYAWVYAFIGYKIVRKRET